VTGPLRVWAPRPGRVAAVVDGRTVEAEPAGGGWWAADAGEPGPGTRYGWSLDGGPVRADPRGPRLPDGVEGPSAVADLGAHAWGDAGFRAPPLGSWVIYELHVGTFTAEGTFDAAAERLDHLVELGVTTVEVMPVAAFPGRHGWGYDGVALYAVHEPYGGPAAFHRFVDACHGRGLAVVLDVVYNHLGPMGNHLAEFGPYFTDRVATPWGQAVNLDGPGSDEVRRFFVDNALQWLRDFHVDGLRLDAVHALHDESARPFLTELADEVSALAAAVGRPLVLIAESDRSDPRTIEPQEAGGVGLHGMWADDVHHALHVGLTGERDGYYADFTGTPSEIADVLTHGFRFRGTWSPSRARRHGRALHPATPLHRLVAALQTHDQVGNRARGDRIGHLVDPARLYAASAVVLTAPHVPMLFQGEEWCASTPFLYFTDHPDPELAEAVRRGRRREFAAFGWAPGDVPDPQDPATRDSSVLRWDERGTPGHAEMLAWYRDLLALRRREPALRDARQGSVGAAGDDAAGTVVVRRGDVAVVADVGGRGGRVTLAGDHDADRAGDPAAGDPAGGDPPVEVLLASPGSRLTGGDAVLPPGGALVARVAGGVAGRGARTAPGP
jgi:maltooligosyltrehalose trehalohydrolase